MIFVGLYFLVGVACLLSNNGKKRMSRIAACVLFFIGIQCLLGLRHIQYGGVDTQVYARDFMRIVNQHYSFLDIFQNFYKDLGFYLFAKVFSMFSSNMNAWLFVCALPYTVGVTWLIYKYSSNIFLSFIMFLSYGYYLYNFQLMRHVFALGLVILAYKYLEEGQYKKYFITVIIASFFHTIAILFLCAYFLRRGKINIKQVIWIFLGGLLVIIISQKSVLISIFNMIPFLSNGRFSQYSTRGGRLSSEFIIQLFFLAVSWVALYKKNNTNELIIHQEKKLCRRKEIKEKFKLNISNGVYVTASQNLTLQFNMSVIAALFYLLTIAIGESYRMAQYFSLFTIILVPNALKRLSRNQRLLFEMFIIFFGIWHFFGGLLVEGSVYNPYVFFWDMPQSLY